MMASRRKPIIAVDFDGVMALDAWPNVGEPCVGILEALRWSFDRGALLVLNTCRKGEQLAEALRFLAKEGIVLEAANENAKVAIAMFGGDTRKIYADLYIDDKATGFCRDKVPGQIEEFMEAWSEHV